MSWHHLVNEIIRMEEEEIVLYQQIAENAPTAALRDLVCRMEEHERRELHWWQSLLKNDGYMPDCGMPDGYMPGGYAPGGYMPGDGYTVQEKKKKRKE